MLACVRGGKKHPQHKIYPYLLRGLKIDRPNQVWCADITYIPMRRGFLYLVAIMDWATRKVLAWRLSNTMEAEFCVEALKDALARYGPPEIFNSDQGSQFTSDDFTQVLIDAKVKISMDGRGRWIPLVDCKQSPAGNGQSHDRAPLALPEIRMRLPARF
jgi:putative transposase